MAYLLAGAEQAGSTGLDCGTKWNTFRAADTSSCKLDPAMAARGVTKL